MPELAITEFADRLSEVMPVVMKEFSRRLSGGFKERVTLPQLLILEFLEKEQAVKMKDLACFMGVSTAAATGIIDRLVKYSYVLRVPDLSDRRIIRVKLTPRAAELVKKLNLQRRQIVTRIFGMISQNDRQDYLRILSQIRDILLNDDNAGPFA